MPNISNCSRPNSLAVMTDAARLDPCAMTAPMRDHTVRLANRPRRESAPHVVLIACMALYAGPHLLNIDGRFMRSYNNFQRNTTDTGQLVTRRRYITQCEDRSEEHTS